MPRCYQIAVYLLASIIATSRECSAFSVQVTSANTRINPTMARPTSFNSSSTRSSSSLLMSSENEQESPQEEQGNNNNEGEVASDHQLPSENASDILNSPAFLKRKLEVLTSDIANVDQQIQQAKEVLEANKAEWKTQFDDLDKEYVNIQKRLSQRSEEGTNIATREVARDILKSLDIFDRAFGIISPTNDQEAMIESQYKDVYNNILNVLGSLGVKPVTTVGTEFDYEVHQAVMMRPDEDYEEGIVCEELAKGFVMEDGHLIRAAMVVVAA